MKQGRLGYNSSNDRYGLLSSDLWIDTGFHCGEGLEKKLDAMVNREAYSKFKTAPTEEEREKFRQEYLDRKGMQESFRW